jgi:hypothetical protein
MEVADLATCFALAMNFPVAEVLVNNLVLGPIKGRGDRDRTSLAQNAKFAWDEIIYMRCECSSQTYSNRVFQFHLGVRTSSTWLAERSEPSPSLFKDSKGGNSHSMSGKDGVLGFSMAALIASMARLSLPVQKIEKV